MAHRLTAVVALSVVTLSGCADFGGPISGSNQGVLSPQERRLQDLENKSAQMSRRLDTMTASGSDQELARLRDEVRDLRGMIEKLRYDSEQRDRLGKDQYKDLDMRLQRFEAGGQPSVSGAAPSAPPAMMPGASPGIISSAPTPQRPTIASPEEEAAYVAAFDLAKNGKYDDAIRAFRSMLDRWPQGRYADNALYWMSDASFMKRDYATALTGFQSLVDRYPGSPKLADGLVKVGWCQSELRRTAEAKATLQRVLREYPNTNAANQAKLKLDQLGG